jgi:hypothetical protein
MIEHIILALYIYLHLLSLTNTSVGGNRQMQEKITNSFTAQPVNRIKSKMMA